MPIINKFAKFYLQKIIGLALPKDVIKYSVNRHREKIAVIDQGRQITYGELYKRAMKLANTLIGLGLNKGDKLGVLLYNCQEYFEIRIAAYFTGIVLVPVIWDMELESIILILNSCEVKCLIYHSDILGDNLDEVKQKTGVKDYIAVPYGDSLLSENSDEPKIKIELDDIASINFSSGTTGRSKGVCLSQASWVGSFYNMIINAAPQAVKGERTFLHILSLATAGSTSFLTLFFVGARQIILKKYNTEECVDLIIKNGVNTIYASPCVITDIVEYIGEKNIKLGLSAIFAGTENFSPARFKEAIEIFGPIIRRGYGMVECLPPISLISPEEYLKDGQIIGEKLRSCGKAAKGVNLKIVDASLKEIEAGKIGRVALKSPSISSGYWKEAALTARHYRDGWFYSNDYGYLDRDGYLYIPGRIDDKIETNRMPFFTGEIEDALNEYRAVKEACVIKAGNGRIVVAISLKKEYNDTKAADIIEFCEKRLGKDETPQEIRILERLPKNASCKLDRQAIKKIFA